MPLKFVLPGLSLAAVIALAPVAVAAKPPTKPKTGPNAVTLDVKSSIIVFSGATTLSGRLTGAGASGAGVRLEQDDSRPYGDSYKPAG